MKSFVLGYLDPDDSGINILAVILRATRQEALQAIGSRDLRGEGNILDAIDPPTQEVGNEIKDACAIAFKGGCSVLLIEVPTVA